MTESSLNPHRPASAPRDPSRELSGAALNLQVAALSGTDRVTAPVVQAPPRPPTTETPSVPRVPMLPLPEGFSAGEAATLIADLQNRMGNTRKQSTVEDMKAASEKRTQLNEKRLESIEKARQAMAEAGSDSWWSKALSIGGLVLSAVVAGAMLATGVGAPLAIAAFTAIGLGLLQEGLNLFAPEFMQEHAWVGVTLCVLQIAASVATFGAMALSSGANASVALINVADNTKKIAQTVRVVATIAQSITTATQAGLNIDSAQHAQEASYAQAEARRLDSRMLQSQAVFDETVRSLKKILQDLTDGMNTCSQMMSANNEAGLAISRTRTV